VINYHKHLVGCMNNESLRRCCIACKFDAWQSAKHAPSVMGKTFAQLLTQQDAKMLRAMLISWEEGYGSIVRPTHSITCTA
jgi:hypothetical protein